MTVTSLLKTELRGVAAAEIVTEFTHGAIGTNNTTPTAGDTTLGTEVFRDTADAVDNPGTGIVTASLRVLSTEANGNSIAEYGWLDAASGGNLWTRNVITAINKTSDIQLYLDTQITIQVEEV
ncbi:hypothetical protein LCGC14_1843080 [marine sediment metagenome]|uniref:Uncharacterized protein n=1 Tax=marine sediment metagenome TaxID=412755 RepID=A0A0F9GCM7_9ZZZZ